MKSIKTKIIFSTVATTVITAMLVGVIAITSMVRGMEGTMISSMREMAEMSAVATDKFISHYTGIVNEIASNDVFVDPNHSLDDVKRLMDKKLSQYYMSDYDITDKNGVSLITGQNVSGEDFYTKTMASGSYMTIPYVNQQGDKAMFKIASKVNDDRYGIVYFYVDHNQLHNLTVSMVTGNVDEVYILDKEGLTIAYSADPEAPFTNENLIKQKAQGTVPPDRKLFAEVEGHMVEGKHDAEIYSYDKIKYIQGYSPISSSDGWSVAVVVMRSKFMGAASQGMTLILIAMSISLAIGIAWAIAFGRTIANPISACVKRLLALSNGDLKTPVPTTKQKDETKTLAESTQRLVDSLSSIIGDIDHTLKEMAAGNMTVAPKVEYIGDLSPIKGSLIRITESLNETLVTINNSASQVSQNSSDVAQSVNDLASASAEQSAIIETLSETTTMLTEKLRNTADNSKETARISKDTTDKILSGNEHMQQLIEAMDGINESSNQIKKIINTIDEIAFQTNMLALNASVEAARAGAAGKGFSVVADEVRNLASKSSVAAKDTANLIERSIEAVNKGVNIASQTADELLRVVSLAKSSSELVEKITNETGQQAVDVEQLRTGISQMSDSLDIHAHTITQNADASTELSMQANTLKELVSHFKLNEDERINLIERSDNIRPYDSHSYDINLLN